MSSTFYYQFDASQRMTLRFSETFVDTTKREASYFSYNQRDQVTRLASEKGASPDALRTFTYNGLGTLVYGQDGTATPSYFAWDGSRMILENCTGNSTRVRWGRAGQHFESVSPDLTRANPVQEQWGRTAKLVGPATNQYLYNVSGEREAATEPLGSTIPTQNRIQGGPDPSFIRLTTTLESYIDPKGRVCLPAQNVFACGENEPDPRIPNPPVLYNDLEDAMKKAREDQKKRRGNPEMGPLNNPPSYPMADVPDVDSSKVKRPPYPRGGWYDWLRQGVVLPKPPQQTFSSPMFCPPGKSPPGTLNPRAGTPLSGDQVWFPLKSWTDTNECVYFYMQLIKITLTAPPGAVPEPGMRPGELVPNAPKSAPGATNGDWGWDTIEFPLAPGGRTPVDTSPIDDPDPAPIMRGPPGTVYRNDFEVCAICYPPKTTHVEAATKKAKGVVAGCLKWGCQWTHSYTRNPDGTMVMVGGSFWAFDGCYVGGGALLPTPVVPAATDTVRPSGVFLLKGTAGGYLS